MCGRGVEVGVGRVNVPLPKTGSHCEAMVRIRSKQDGVSKAALPRDPRRYPSNAPLLGLGLLGVVSLLYKKY